jgi:hypothetical protein
MTSYIRDISITVGKRNGAGREFFVHDKTYESLRLDFNIRKNIDKAENSGTIEIYNMNLAHYTDLCGVEDLVVHVKAGYKLAKVLLPIFLGDVTEFNLASQANGGNIVNISAKEGLYANQHSMLRKSYPENTKLNAVISDCKKVLENLGITVNDEFKAITKMANKEKLMATTLVNGYAASDYAINIVASLVKNFNYKVYINNNVLIIAPADAPLQEQAVYLHRTTGLIGTPAMTKDGTLEFKALLDARVTLGSRVVVETDYYKKTVVINEIRYYGSTYDGSFMMDCEGIM